ncbi:glycosyltransferase family 2 protein [Cellvibrio mixtus]|uniref:glycosyltransferase family 2 protein n=1 Tax=Cellvibrio mixtus TaxID=39650 RepID=UPI000587F14C|nr:glycosyltransferase family 2 protein [Cellvibrio mixtus]
MPPIATIIVNYNAGPVLVECISAVIEQASEVILVDNASHDQSLALVEARFVSDTRVTIIRNDTNLGFAAACNIGARAAGQPFLFFLNPDCICGPDSLTRLYHTLLQNPKAGMAGGLLLNPDGTEQAGGRRLTPTPGRTLVRSFGLQRLARHWPDLLVDFNLHRQPLPSAPISIEAISGACMLVKPEALAQIGLWDEGYFLHCEDLDWCLRFTRAGWDILFVPDAPFSHAQGTCSKSRPLFVEWHKHKGMSRFYRKFFRTDYPLPLLWLVLAAIWVRFGAICALQSLRSTNR